MLSLEDAEQAALAAGWRQLANALDPAGGRGGLARLLGLDDHLSQVLVDVAAERIRQDAQWGGPAHDDTLRPGDWSRVLRRLLAEADAAAGDVDTYPRKLVQIAAVAVAAIQVRDRFVLRMEGEKCDLARQLGVHGEPALRDRGGEADQARIQAAASAGKVRAGEGAAAPLPPVVEILLHFANGQIAALGADGQQVPAAQQTPPLVLLLRDQLRRGVISASTVVRIVGRDATTVGAYLARHDARHDDSSPRGGTTAPGPGGEPPGDVSSNEGGSR